MEFSTQQEVYRHLREHRDLLGRFAEQGGVGWPEISDGRLITMMSPAPRHQLLASRIRDDLAGQIRVTDSTLVCLENTDVEDPVLGKLRIPDLIVLPESAADVDAVDPREILLAVEIVSRSNPSNDLIDKVRDYPLMGIPHYLIIDPRDGTATHHFTLDNGRYAERASYVFGEDVAVAGWTVHTGSLRRYPKDEYR